jgi:hypothetical protein
MKQLLISEVLPLTLRSWVLLAICLGGLGVIWLVGQLDYYPQELPLVIIAGPEERAIAKSAVEKIARIKPIEESSEVSAWSAMSAHHTRIVLEYDYFAPGPAHRWSIFVKAGNLSEYAQLQPLVNVILHVLDEGTPQQDTGASRVTTKSRVITLPLEPSSDHRAFVPKIICLMTLALAFATSVRSYTREKLYGALFTLEAITQSHAMRLAIAKICVSACLALAFLLFALSCARILYGFNIKSDVGLLIASFVIPLLTSAASGLAIAIVSHETTQAYVLSFLYLLGMTLFTGFLFPLEQASAVVAALSQLYPLTYVLTPVEDWMNYGLVGNDIKGLVAVPLAQFVLVSLLTASLYLIVKRNR